MERRTVERGPYPAIFTELIADEVDVNADSAGSHGLMSGRFRVGSPGRHGAAGAS